MATKKLLRGMLATVADMMKAPQDFTGTGAWNVPGTLMLDKDITGYRVQRVCNKGGGVRDISPRLSAGEMEAFLSGMLAAMYETADRSGK